MGAGDRTITGRAALDAATAALAAARTLPISLARSLAVEQANKLVSRAKAVIAAATCRRSAA